MLSDIEMKDGFTHSQKEIYSEHITQSYSKLITFKKKIIQDNLLTSETVFSQGKVEGLLCFPIKNKHEKIVKIIIPNLNYLSSNLTLRQTDIELIQ